MIPREHLATVQVPGQSGELKLYRHDKDYFFMLNGAELMTSRAHGSEELLAELALARIADLSSARVLVGGLGMGFTLASVLGLVGAGAKVDVVELVPEVIAWNREWFGEMNGHPLGDDRVTLIEGDVIEYIRKASSNPTYDAILLDVDNGPEGMTREDNDWLYGKKGLTAARNALRPGGALAVWSSANHPWFTKRVTSAGLEVTEERVRARRTKGPRRTIWVGVRPRS